MLLAEAQAQQCDHIVTMGAGQSNHCRQTAAAAAKLGMGCSLILRGDEPPHSAQNGNILLQKLFGAHTYWSGDRKLSEMIDEIAESQRKLGHKPTIIPYGGSNVWGAASFVLAMEELMGQLDDLRLNIDFIVLASSSGGTQSGLVLGAAVHGYRGRILGISVSEPAETMKTKVASLATATAAHLNLGTLSLGDRVELNADYAEPGYGVITDTEREAIQLTAQMEGILLDPVYTGRAMGGLIDLIRWGAFTRGQRILFWHTGGLPSLFAMMDAEVSKKEAMIEN